MENKKKKNQAKIRKVISAEMNALKKTPSSSKCKSTIIKLIKPPQAQSSLKAVDKNTIKK